MVVIAVSSGAAAFAATPDNTAASALQVAARLAIPGQALAAQVAAEAMRAAAEGLAVNATAD